ncbi:MAG: OmpA family protein [Alphaproteobacteria bacterium]|nr:OmpA family protein [Alphaproteobacteria bacterium]
MNDIPEKEKKSPEKQIVHVTAPRRFGRRMGDQRGTSQSMWLVSFTDVMALMLTFFVLLFAMSNPEPEHWEYVQENIQKNFNNFEGQQLDRGPEDSINVQRINFTQALDLNYLRALMENLVVQHPELKNVRLINGDRSLIVSLPQNLLFDPGKAEIKENANKALYILSGTLARMKNRIEVEGHTDPRPINRAEFSSNWDLSLTRAANVAAVLENVGYSRPITVRGQASGRYEDIADTVPEHERLDLSRRVDIVVMEDDGRREKLFDIGLPETP